MPPTAVDPIGCGCTKCLTGEHVPLDLAMADQIRSLMLGRMDDHTGEEFTYKNGVVGARALRWTLHGNR